MGEGDGRGRTQRQKAQSVRRQERRHDVGLSASWRQRSTVPFTHRLLFSILATLFVKLKAQDNGKETPSIFLDAVNWFIHDHLTLFNVNSLILFLT